MENESDIENNIIDENSEQYFKPDYPLQTLEGNKK